MLVDAIMIKDKDNVATAFRDICENEEVYVIINEGRLKINVLEKIPYGHKFATIDIKHGENIYKYGEIIGRATKNINSGCHAHTHNIESLRGRGDL